MRTIVLSVTMATAIAAGASFGPAQAMTVSTASGIQAALADEALVQDAAYSCRHRFYTSRRLCWWSPGVRRYWRRRW
jgi:hypothetical protein